jgi:hypothetical protein
MKTNLFRAEKSFASFLRLPQNQFRARHVKVMKLASDGAAKKYTGL